MNPRRSLLAIMAILAGSPALAHSFYPYECCSDVDCFPVPVARDLVQRRPGGWWLIKEQILIPFDQARTSPDGRFHICRDQLGKGRLITPKDKPPCLWAPAVEG